MKTIEESALYQCSEAFSALIHLFCSFHLQVCFSIRSTSLGSRSLCLWGGHWNVMWGGSWIRINKYFSKIFKPLETVCDQKQCKSGFKKIQTVSKIPPGCKQPILNTYTCAVCCPLLYYCTFWSCVFVCPHFHRFVLFLSFVFSLAPRRGVVFHCVRYR